MNLLRLESFIANSSEKSFEFLFVEGHAISGEIFGHRIRVDGFDNLVNQINIGVSSSSLSARSRTNIWSLSRISVLVISSSCSETMTRPVVMSERNLSRSRASWGIVEGALAGVLWGFRREGQDSSRGFRCRFPVGTQWFGDLFVQHGRLSQGCACTTLLQSVSVGVNGDSVG